jgi:hypothetical protein
METTINTKAEKIKEIIHSSAIKSKETIRQLIDNNAQHLGTALDANKKMIDSIKGNLAGYAMEDAITPDRQVNFDQSIQLAEDTLDSIINSYTSQMESNVDFNTHLIEAIKESKGTDFNKVLELIQENFVTSRELTLKNTQEVLDFYYRHTNLAVNFNEKFGGNINAQLDALFAIQSRGQHRFTEWASDWWKTGHEERT